MLEKFRAAKAAEIRRLKDLEVAQRLPLPYTGKRPPFSDAPTTRSFWRPLPRPAT